MKASAAFRCISEQHAGQWRRVVAIDCRTCGKQDTALVKSDSDDVRSKYWTGRGWRPGHRPTEHLCPTCAAHPAATKEKPVPAEADQPRQPTREQRRKINDALDAHYLPERGCYAKAFSDKALAETLNVPRAWVAEERDRLFGPDVNEAQAAQTGALMALEARAQAAEDMAMKAAAEAEAVKKDAATLRTRMTRAAA